MANLAAVYRPLHPHPAIRLSPLSHIHFAPAHLLATTRYPSALRSQRTAPSRAPIPASSPLRTLTTNARATMPYSSTSAATAGAAAAAATTSAHAPSTYQKVLTASTINPHVKSVEYAVRGELSNRANRYQDQLSHPDDPKSHEQKLPFDSIISANIGNPQQQPHLAQKPLTFWRQVAALTEYPALIDDPAAQALFPSDARERARELLRDVGSVGAYSHSKGVPAIRKHVAEFIEELIYLTSGASQGVQLLMSVLISGPSVGVMVPIPQYPLYSAALALYDAHMVRYELNDAEDWAVDVAAMERSCDEARARGVDVRALVVINPGNPTGSCLTHDNIRDILRLAHRKRLVVMADEVYQANIYQPKERPFVSFKRVLRDFASSTDASERRVADETELVSFHSISKGVTGECGRRGGYFELANFDAEVESQVYKIASVNLCSSLQGQIGVDLLVRPPREGEPSHAQWRDETEAIHATLRERSQKMRAQFESLPGVECGEPQGALYLFPRITLPRRAVEAAEREGRLPDLYYCLRLLDASGICVVPGSGFGKMPTTTTTSPPEGAKGKEGDEVGGTTTIFLRTTTLAKESDAFVRRFADFHRAFLEEFA